MEWGLPVPGRLMGGISIGAGTCTANKIIMATLFVNRQTQTEHRQPNEMLFCCFYIPFQIKAADAQEHDFEPDGWARWDMPEMIITP
jgi:hypothetical protein